MKNAPNIKHLPKDKGTEAVIFAGTKAWELAKGYQVSNKNGDDIPPIVLDHQQLSELDSLTIIDKGRMYARVYQAGLVDQSKLTLIAQKLAAAGVKQAQLYSEAGELVEDWTESLERLAAEPVDVYSGGVTDLSRMGPSQRGDVLKAHYGNALAIHGDSDTVHHYNGAVWSPISDKGLQRVMSSIFRESEIAYSQPSIKSAVDTMKLSLPMMGTTARNLIGFVNGVFDTKAGEFRPHRQEDWLLIASSAEFSPAVEGETLASHAPSFWRWLCHSVANNTRKADRVLAALYMVMANRYDWQLFLELTGPGGSGKSVFADICEMLAGKNNTTSASMSCLENPKEREILVGCSLIVMSDMARYAGDGAGIKAITGGDKVAINPKYKTPYSMRIPAVVLAVNNNSMTFNDRSGGISRRRVIFNFTEVVQENERDPFLAEKVGSELPVIIRHLLNRFADQRQAKQLLHEQQKSEEALAIKREGDSLVDFCGYLMALVGCEGMFIGNAEIIPFAPRRYLYHAYMAYMSAHGLGKPVSLTRFGRDMPGAMAIYGAEYKKERSTKGPSKGHVQSNVLLSDDADEWLPSATGGGKGANHHKE